MERACDQVVHGWWCSQSCSHLMMMMMRQFVFEEML